MIAPAIKMWRQQSYGNHHLLGGLRQAHRAAPQAHARSSLPRTLVVVPVFLLLIRISVFIKGHVETGFGYIDAYAIAEIMLTAATILVLLWDKLTSSVTRIVAERAVGLLLLYYIFAILSSLWSKMPLYTLFRGVEALSQFIAIFVILAHARSMAARELTFLLACVVAIVAELTGAVRLIGGVSSIAALHTCSYSNVGLVLFAYCVAEYPGCEPFRRRRLLWFGAIGLAAIVVGTSATTNVSAVLGILVALIVSARRDRSQRVTSLAVCLITCFGLLTLFARESVLAWLMPNKTQLQIQGLTGRVNLWGDLMGLVQESPVLGHGFVASTRSGGLRIFNAHNVFLQALLDTGIVGTAILVIALAALAASCIRELKRGSPRSAGFAAAFAALLPVNLTVPIWGVGWEKLVFAWAFLVGLHTLSSLQPSRAPSCSTPIRPAWVHRPVWRSASLPIGGRR